MKISNINILFLSYLFVFIANSSIAQTSINLLDSSKKNEELKNYNLHFQSTYIYQYQPVFSAKYSGVNSLKTAEDKENSITGTIYFGLKLWKGAEIYINPEIAGGSGLSGAYGLAASCNGESFRIGDVTPTLYLARGLFTQTFAIGNRETSFVDEGINELGGNKYNNFIKFSIGKMSLGDIFDNNVYSNSPRTQFLNWCLMNNGAWDYAANLRGYTYAFATILQQGSMAYKFAIATLPVVANGLDLNTNLNEEYSLNAEISKSYSIWTKRKGNLRILGYYNNGHMGNYNQAMQHIDSTGIPNIINTRQYGRTKTGIGASFDQQISNNTGIFARAGYNDGNNETWAFTEADRTLSAGIAINGTSWHHKEDILSLAIVTNGLSEPHRTYLEKGGLGFQLGDGKLSYANETVIELNYNFKPLSTGIWFTYDYQLVLNPGYNADRGPVNVFSLRVHVEI